MKLTQYIGDTKAHAVALTWGGAAFTPTGWTLIFTAKNSAEDTDAEAIIQKTSGAGITTSGTTATVTILRADTVDLAVGKLVCDIQAQNDETGEVRTVAIGSMKLLRDVTREVETSVPVVTTTDPLPASVTAAFSGASNAGALTGAEQVLLNQSGVVKATLTVIKNWLLSVLTPATLGAAPSYPRAIAIIADGAALDGEYSLQRILTVGALVNGRPSYGGGDVSWTGQWTVSIPTSGDPLEWESFDDVASPDLATLWSPVAPNDRNVTVVSADVVRQQAAIAAGSLSTQPMTLNTYEKSQVFANLGIPSYANLTAANAALDIGKPFYNEALGTLDITTS